MVTNSIGHFRGPYKWYIWFRYLFLLIYFGLIIFHVKNVDQCMQPNMHCDLTSFFQFFNFLKNFWRPFWAYLWLESKTMVFVRSSKVTNGWLVTIRDPESVIVTLQGYALQGYNGFLGVTHGYQFHWSLSRTLQMVHCMTHGWCFKEILVFTFGWNLKQWYL